MLLVYIMKRKHLSCYIDIILLSCNIQLFLAALERADTNKIRLMLPFCFKTKFMKIKGHGPYLIKFSLLSLDILSSNENANNGLFCSFSV